MSFELHTHPWSLGRKCRTSRSFASGFCAAVLLAWSCTPLECPEGQFRKGTVCVPDLEAGSDASVDAVDADAEQSDSDAPCDPDAPEVCNGKDDNCNGKIDEDVDSVVYQDNDDDGFGAGEPLKGCVRQYFVASDGDCNDADPDVHPEADEVCNEVDDDCDGETDEGLLVTVYRDADGDGYGDDATEKTVCEGASSPGWVLRGGDCDEACKTCNPGNPYESLCDGKDDDCRGGADDGLSTFDYALDCDGDGYFPASAKKLNEQCKEPAKDPACASGRWIVVKQYQSYDCNDQNSVVYPLAPEKCNDGIDSDCDGDSSSAEPACK